MGGGLLQLVAYGAQDIYLTGNPQITFFKVVYRRHTNFAMEAIENVFNGSAGFGKRVTCQISRNGDLIHRMYVQVKLPALQANGTYWTYHIGQRVLADVEIEIGGQRIDKHYSYWLYIWNELSLPEGKVWAYRKMIGASTGTVVNATPYNGTSTGSSGQYNLFVPLEFWFNRNVGLALPLIALQYHEVKINIDFETLANCITRASGAPSTSGLGDLTSSLWVDYIYLDTDERRRFAQLSHEYLIEQLQFTGDESISDLTVAKAQRIKMNFNHPVKELIWVAQADLRVNASSTTHANNWTNFTRDACSFAVGTVAGDANVVGSLNSVEESASTNIQLNGQDRFYAREGSYFNLVQPYQHHERAGNNPGINVYSFALKPEEHQPSGTLNFSRIDTAYLNVKLAGFFNDASTLATSTVTISGTITGKIKVFAVNYNVLRIMSGMGGLAYSN